MENTKENCEKIWKIQKKIAKRQLNNFENMDENSEMILKKWKKGKLNSEKIFKIQKKSKLNSEKIWKIQK